jgi:hypothetical protein
VLKRILVVAVIATLILFVASVGTVVSGVRNTILSSCGVGIAVVIWTSIRRPGVLVHRSAVVLACLVALAALPIDVRFVPSAHAGVSLGPAIWGPITPQTVAAAPQGAVFMGRCIVPSYPIRYVLAVSF